MLPLRPYQEDAVWRTVNLFSSYRSLLGVAPARSGKTRIALEVARRLLSPDDRMIFAAHTTELAHQPFDRIVQSCPDLMPAGIVQGKRRDTSARVICGTIKSLINNIEAIGAIDFLVVDEAHHALSNTHLKLIELVRYANPRVKILYITATPHRADGLGLRDVCEAVAFVIPIGKLIREGWLVEPVPCPIPLYNIDLGGIRIRGGDFMAGDLGQRMNTPEANRQIVNHWLRYARGRKTLVYTATIKHAEAIAKLMSHAGVKSASVTGKTKDPLAMQKRMVNGDLQVVTNALKWTEGVDIPPVSCIVMARPLIASRSLYIQSATRGMTAHSGKTDCLIMDVVPKYQRDLLGCSIITENIDQPMAPAHEAAQFLHSLSSNNKPTKGVSPPMARRPVMRSRASLLFERMLDDYERA